MIDHRSYTHNLSSCEIITAVINHVLRNNIFFLFFLFFMLVMGKLTVEKHQIVEKQNKFEMVTLIFIMMNCFKFIAGKFGEIWLFIN